ncbi:MAG: polyphosphate kinase 2 family protein [Acidobacteriota bacterium]|nr:MAG: polyphosphate kinase 2 family protein [Acidobacteriota bacterium]
MSKSVSDLYRVPFDGQFKRSAAPTSPPKKHQDKKQNKRKLARLTEELDELQRKLYANDQYSLLLIFQAMDAAGKDSTIRAVLSGVNPAGCQVFSFKQPSAEELDHDFLWRTARSLPERGRIGVFNRSYYEEVLVVRVHPEYLSYQKLPHVPDLPSLWKQRYESIRDHERHLTRNGMIILKFWLNVSREEQKQRFLSRLEEPEKNWKFSEGDLKERKLWDDYMAAYEEALNATSTPEAPWFAIPADDKPFMRASVAQIIVEHLNALNLSYPSVDQEQLQEFNRFKKQLKDPSS